MWACRCVLGTQGTAMVLIHATISFCVAQFRSQFLSWLCSLSLLSTLRLQDVEEVKVRVSVSFFLYQWEGENRFCNANIQVDAFVFGCRSKNWDGAPPRGRRGCCILRSFVSDFVLALQTEGLTYFSPGRLSRAHPVPFLSVWVSMDGARRHRNKRKRKQ